MNKLKQILQPAQKPIRWFRKIRTRNKIIIVVGVLLVGFLIFRQIQGSNAQPKYLTQAVERASVAQIVSETGNIDTAGRVDVYSSSTGIIEKIYIEDGAPVKIGQNLFQIRSTATDQEKASAYATYQNAVTAYNQALNTYRDKQAITQKVEDDVKDHSLDETFTQKATRTTAQVARDSAYDATKSTEASLNSTELAYYATQNLIVKAPSTGTVANLSYKIGDKVIAGSTTIAGSTIGGMPILTIANFSDYIVKLALNEVDVPKVKEGQSAKLTLDAFPGKTFEGKVVHIDSIGTNTSGVITYNIVIEIINPEDSIRPAMTANVDIEVDKAENVLTVPNNAIKPYEGKKAVQVIDPQTKTAKYVPVEVGIKSPERTQIKSGVDEGTQVITGTKNGAVKPSGGGGPFGG